MEAKAACPQCKQVMDTEVTFVLPSAMPKVASSSPCGAAGDETGGYVKGLVTYMVTDGLEVTPVRGASRTTGATSTPPTMSRRRWQAAPRGCRRKLLRCFLPLPSTFSSP
ncbi:hypothetical protein ZWY2020_028666 [Hordeum vulgare]|nr:hypothetical protein ZWY2020_028666 [Hordeum vulgare]